MFILFKSTEISFVSSGYPCLILTKFSAFAFQQYNAITVVVGAAMYVANTPNWLKSISVTLIPIANPIK